jgi:L-ribulose-5-phosphate 3-epimerase
MTLPNTGTNTGSTNTGSTKTVGVNTMSFMWRTGAREALEIFAHEGYRVFEVMAQKPHFDPFMALSEARAFGRFLRDAGLAVETINIPSLDQNLASGTPEMRAHSIKLFERLIGIAECISAEGIIVVTGRVNPLIQPARRELEGWFHDAFTQVLRMAEAAGVDLLLENIPMGVHPRADQLLDFARQLDSPRVGICYDIANAHFIGEDVVRGLETVAERLSIVHLSDTRRDVWRHDPVGRGSCDFAGFCGGMMRMGYSRTAMLEIVSENAVADTVSSHHALRAYLPSI